MQITMIPSLDKKNVERLRMGRDLEIDQYIMNELQGNRSLLAYSTEPKRKKRISVLLWRKWYD